jgi:hypothetical protein
VRFAGAAPRVTAKRAQVTAKLTRGGATYAVWQGAAKRGPLHLTLKAKRALAPGSYKLTVTIAGKRLTPRRDRLSAPARGGPAAARRRGSGPSRKYARRLTAADHRLAASSTT